MRIFVLVCAAAAAIRLSVRCVFSVVKLLLLLAQYILPLSNANICGRRKLHRGWVESKYVWKYTELSFSAHTICVACLRYSIYSIANTDTFPTTISFRFERLMALQVPIGCYIGLTVLRWAHRAENIGLRVYFFMRIPAKGVVASYRYKSRCCQTQQRYLWDLVVYDVELASNLPFHRLIEVVLETFFVLYFHWNADGNL